MDAIELLAPADNEQIDSHESSVAICTSGTTDRSGESFSVARSSLGARIVHHTGDHHATAHYRGVADGRKVIATIEHLSLDVELIDHDLFNGALQLPTYLAINANAKVPTLVDGDFVLWESNAIMQYLAEQNGDEHLLPRDVRARAELTRWQLWESAHFNAAFGALAFEVVAKPHSGIAAPDESVISNAMRQLARFAPVLEHHLKGKRYLVGDHLTIADFSVATFECYREITPFDWRPFSRANAYFDRMKELPAWVRSKHRNESLRNAQAA